MRIALLLLFFSAFAYAQSPSPAPAQEQGILISNATIHNGRGVRIDEGDIYFEAGKIVYLGPSGGYSPPSKDILKIDANGGHVYPGFIALDNTLGLVEINAVAASKDHSEVGDFNPSLRTLIAYNTDSEVIPTIRSNGTLISQPSPSSGTICGQSSIVQLDAWNWEDAVVKADDGIFLNYPDVNSYGWWMDEKQKAESRKKKLKDLELLGSYFEDARAYSQKANQTPKNLNFESMRGLFDGTKNLYIRADNAKAIMDAVQFARNYQVQSIVIRGGKEVYVVKDFLKENDIPVILSKMHSNPSRAEDDIDIVYRQPAILKEAGVTFCIGYDRGHDGQRNLGFVAGSAKAYGLAYEDAITAITYSPAKIIGIEKEYGSLEEGKSATLFLSTGDALDMLGNQVTHAFIDGRNVDLNDKQKELARKYGEKYGIEE